MTNITRKPFENSVVDKFWKHSRCMMFPYMIPPTCALKRVCSSKEYRQALSSYKITLVLIKHIFVHCKSFLLNSSIHRCPAHFVKLRKHSLPYITVVLQLLLHNIFVFSRLFCYFISYSQISLISSPF